MSDCVYECAGLFPEHLIDVMRRELALECDYIREAKCSEIQVSEQKQPGDIFLTAYSEHPIIVFINLPLNKTMGGLWALKRPTGHFSLPCAWYPS